jgi:hypothetical protein
LVCPGGVVRQIAIARKDQFWDRYLEAALIFLEINDESLNASDEELVDLVLKTTVGQVGKQEIAEFF